MTLTSRQSMVTEAVRRVIPQRYFETMRWSMEGLQRNRQNMGAMAALNASAIRTEFARIVKEQA